MLRRKVNRTTEEAAGQEGSEGKAPEGTAPVPSEPSAPEPEAKVEATPPDSEDAKPEPKPEPTAEESLPTGPAAHHSPEPQTPAERLTAQQQETYLQERKANSKRQRAADKAKRKADRKAAKAARKAARNEDPLDLDPYAPISPDAADPGQAPVTPDRPTDPPPGSPAAAIAAAAAETETEGRHQPPAGGYPPVELPPIHHPGQAAASRRTAPLIGGIDLGGTKIAAAVIGPDNEVIAYRRRPTPDRGGPADVVRAMAATMQEAAEDAGTEAHRLLAVGVGSPGSVDSATGDVTGAGNLPDWDGRFRLGQALSDEVGAPVKVGNDVQVGTRAEFELGAGAEFSSLLGVFWGTGVGGGIIIDGKPWLGRGRAGEIGHTLVRRGGAKEPNGLHGTVEAYAGRKAMEAKALREVKKGRKTKLFKLMKKHDKTHLTSAIWQRALDGGDELAEDLLNRAVGALSAGIASAVNLLDVEAVVIGGGLGVRFADTLVPQIIEGMDEYLLNKDRPPVVRVAALGDEGGVIGASLLVRDALEANKAPSA